MIQVPWIDGECGECGDAMKVYSTFHPDFTCKACKMLQAIERIAYALEVKVGIE
jgi:hypothetical protein